MSGAVSFPVLYAAAEAAVAAGCFELARSLWIHCADLPLSLAQLSKLTHLSTRIDVTPSSKRGKVRLAILASCTTDHLREPLVANLTMRGFEVELYVSPFDSIQQEVLNADSGLYAFAPTHVLIWMTAHDSIHFEQLMELWDTLHGRLPGCQLMQTTVVIPAERPLGGLESRLDSSASSLIRELNEKICQNPNSVLPVDLDWLSCRVGKSRWHDPRFWFHSRHACSPDATAVVSSEITRQISAHLGLSKKCIVLDLDGTLWGGVVADDGLDGIQLGEGPLGEAFSAFQIYLKSLKERGIILAVCSKNDETTAREPFQCHTSMVLKEQDISLFVANWENKADGIQLIAQTLGIGLESLVFCDDNPAERKLVRDFLPDVYTVELPEDPSHYVETLDGLGLFEQLEISEEDRVRTEQYRANSARTELKKRIGSLDGYLKDLQMTGYVLELRAENCERAVQLLNKSNQFNLMTRRYSMREFQTLLKSPDFAARAFRLTDRFGDNGVIAVLTTLQKGDELWIQDWVMSCRVLSRGMEDFTFGALLELSRQKSCRAIIGRFRPTQKNALVAGLLAGLGFTPMTKSDDEIVYRLELSGAKLKAHPILSGRES